MFSFRGGGGGGGAAINLPTKWACNSLFADEILLHGQNALFLKHNIFSGGWGSPYCGYGPVTMAMVMRDWENFKAFRVISAKIKQMSL